MEQKYVAISATKDKMAISLRGKIKNIGYENYTAGIMQKYVQSSVLKKETKIYQQCVLVDSAIAILYNKRRKRGVLYANF